ncbi:hypothetical protein WNY37_12140 [Henriciella sp. AS95]|uniref:adenosine deaminase n=1 Tax=Henriciella sp. AS95 TaxID=3135782 RepID=UPI003181A2F9
MKVATAPLSAEARTEALFERISDDPVLLRVFLRDMPKGGDLHNHASGTPYAEEYLDWAARRDFCIDEAEEAIVEPPCDGADQVSANGLMRSDPDLYSELVDALSVRDLISGVQSEQSGHKQFFSSFGKFFPIVREEPARTLASVKRLAADDRVSYVELMFNPGPIDSYFSQVVDPEWDENDLEAAFQRLAPEIEPLIQQSLAERRAVEDDANGLLGCEDDQPDAGCDVTVYYNTYGLRRFPNEQLFRQLALGFALIEADPKSVGISLVEPEDDPRSIENYDLHMRMIAFLSEKYPTAKVTLHAGELTLGLAPSSALRTHIRDAIMIAGSQRIGHGIDIAWEHQSRDTLDRMANEKIAVEINLVSNDVILGVRGAQHPLNLYLSSDVPVVLSTDDQGVLRTDMTEQYVRAALEHGLDYAALKQVARNSLEYAFVPGDSIWSEGEVGVISDACNSLSSAACDALAAESPKADLQRQLERDFTAFENDIAEWDIR